MTNSTKSTRWEFGAAARRISWSLLVCFAWLLATICPPVFAVTASGTVISAQALANYQAGGGFSASETVTSNFTKAIVLPVEAVSLTLSQSVNAAPGGIVNLPHVLTNLGNTSSTYTVSLRNQSGDSFDLSGLRVVADLNGNGVVDSNETAIALDTPGALKLAMGQWVNLIVTGTVPGGITAGPARVTLSVGSNSASPATASNIDTVNVSSLAVIGITKSASEVGVVTPGKVVRYTIQATNVGATDATGAPTTGQAGAAIRIDGAAASVFLLRDAVPAGSSYVPGSLSTSTVGALKLYRLPGDATNSYRTNADDAAAVEVAVAVPTGLPRNSTMAMNFAVKIQTQANGVIRNAAMVDFNDGATASELVSNVVLLNLQSARMGISKFASQPVANYGTDGKSDGTSTVTFVFNIRNYGAQPLYDAQIIDDLTGQSRFGTWTAAAVPGSGQYTVVPGSMSVSGVTAGSTLTSSGAYTGSGSSTGLLSTGGVILPNGQATASVKVRFYSADRSGTILNTAQVTSAQTPGGAVIATDDSVNGLDPDPDGDGDPRNNASPTPIRAGLAAIELTKTSTVPTLVAGSTDTFEFEYHFIVKNVGTTVLDNLRVADNLNCTFMMDQTNGPVTSWQLSGPPVMTKGLLKSAGALYTGRVACDRTRLAKSDPSLAMPPELALNLTDGGHSLQPGESEEIVLPVKAVRAQSSRGAPIVLTNKAVVAAYDANRVNGATIVAADASSSITGLADSSGVVYRSSDRTVIAGASVVLRRTTCSASTPGPITASQLLSGNVAGRYTFNPDGSVSMTTGSDGSYQFLLQSPPVNDVCEYALSVVAPAGLLAPSAEIPPTAGVAPGGAVQAQPTPPTGAQSTTYYMTWRLGPGVNNVWNNHIPLDPVAADALFLKKAGSKTTVELGDFLTYTLTLANRSKAALRDLHFVDRLPAGFAYIKGSTRITDGSGHATPLQDPSLAKGAVLTFDLPGVTLAAESEITVQYRVRVGVGATQGDGINRATANSGPIVSNEAAFRVQVTGGVFSDEAILFGKVYLDCNRNGVQDSGELGVPGVRILLENGTSVVTDVEGKWSLYGLKPTTHVVKVDKLTLPEGALLAVLSNRNAGQPDSRFADLKKGELHRADFAITNCSADDGTTVLDAVNERRQALEGRPDAEGVAVLKRQMDAQGKTYVPNDPRALPAAGTVGTAPIQPQMPGAAGASANGGSLNAPEIFTTVVPRMPPRLASNAGPAMSTEPTVAPLEEVIEKLEAGTAFIGLTDKQTMPSDQVNIRVKGTFGSLLRLSVNGDVVPERRVGKKADMPSHQLSAWEYIGVPLRAGENRLVLEELDSFLNPRHSTEITVIAPGKPARLLVEVAGSGVADGQTPISVKVRMVDDKGVQVTARTQVTLETSLGRWADEDLNDMEPGTQVFMEGGVGEFKLMPPSVPGTATIRISGGVLVKEAVVDFLPELRPLVGAGIVEGVIDLRSLGRTNLQPARAKDSFEAELTTFAAESNDGKQSAAARAAFYFKGAIKGEYLLTTAYDSDKTVKERLFRDIQPDEFYPVYGDSSVKSFDAQSTGRFYVRIDKNKSYLLYGDFNTATSPDVRQLSQFNRSVTGLQHHFENENISSTVFASRDTLRQVVEEFPANGTSGPFMLGRGNFYANSEKVELIVRDRRQSSNLLSVTPMARFTDYEIEPTTGRLLFRNPVPSYDEDGNPRSIRVTYEVESGGPAFLIAGAEAQLKLNDAIQVGVSYSRDEDPTKPSTVAGATAVVRLGEKSVGTVEVARTTTLANGVGTGARLEVKHEDENLKIRGQFTSTDNNFDNQNAYAQKGRTDGNLSVAYKASDKVTINAEALDTEDRITGNRTVGVLAGATVNLDQGMQLEAGARVARQEVAGTAASAGSDLDLHTVRLKLTVQPPSLPEAKGYVEAEQDVGVSEKRLLALGGSYQLGEKTRLYGRYEAISSLGNPFQLGTTEQNNVASLGLESTYLEGHSAFSEYRMRDTLAGREDQLATGLRNTWQVSEGLRLGAGFEHTDTLGGVAANRSTALIGSADYAGPGIRLDGRLELRRSQTADTLLNAMGVAYKLDSTWSLLGRSVIDWSRGRGESATDYLRVRQQIGAAYRPVDSNEWNALLRYEHRYEDVDGVATTTDTNPGLVRTHILSAHANYQPQHDLVISGRWALKYQTMDADGLQSSTWAQLYFARALWDLTPKWDAGVQAMLFTGQGSARQAGLGVEVGYLLADNLWLSAGYNAFDLRDSALAGNDYLDRGLYLRLRFKFDEGLFK